MAYIYAIVNESLLIKKVLWYNKKTQFKKNTMGFTNPFSRNKAGADCFLALDIGTEFVKVLVFKQDKNDQRGIVTGFGASRQQLGHMSSGAVSDISGVTQSCGKAIAAAEEMAGVKKVKNSTKKLVTVF